MKQIKCLISSLLLLTVVVTADAVADERLASTLRQVVENNLAAYNRESVSETMTSVHSKSPEYAETMEALSDQFSALDARTELLSLRYIGHDDEFAVARVKYKTVNTSGEPFVANVIDTMTFFHQEDGAWKLWSDDILGVQLMQ